MYVYFELQILTSSTHEETVETQSGAASMVGFLHKLCPLPPDSLGFALL